MHGESYDRVLVEWNMFKHTIVFCVLAACVDVTTVMHLYSTRGHSQKKTDVDASMRRVSIQHANTQCWCIQIKLYGIHTIDGREKQYIYIYIYIYIYTYKRGNVFCNVCLVAEPYKISFPWLVISILVAYGMEQRMEMQNNYSSYIYY